MILAAAMNPETLRGTDETIARVRRGDGDALAELLAQYQHRLYRYLTRLVRILPRPKICFSRLGCV